MYMYVCSTVEPPKKGQARFTSYGLCREVGTWPLLRVNAYKP